MLIPPNEMVAERILLRTLNKGDADAIFNKYAGHKERVTYMAWPVHNSVSDTEAFLDSLTQSSERGLGFGYAVINKDSGEFMGTIGFKNESGRVFFGYILAPEYHGNGFATEAALVLVNWLRSQKEVHRIWAFCDVNNTPSRKVLLKIGLVEDGLVHNWCIAPNQSDQPTDCVFYYLPMA